MGTLRRTHGTFRRAGVTLFELLVVVSIIVVLAGLTFTLFSAAERAIDKIEAQVASANPRLAKHRTRIRPDTPRMIPNQYLVTFKNSVTDPKAEAARLAQAVPANVLNVYTTAIKGCAVRIQPGDLAALQGNPVVARVEQDQLRYPCQAVFPTGVSRIQYTHAPRTPPFQLFFPSAGQPGGQVVNNGPRNLGPGFTTGGPGQAPLKAVAVIDTGIDSTHPDLNVVFSAGYGQPNGQDQDGHGTHVAGIIGARGIGVVGVFPGVPLWSLRVFDAKGGAGTDAIFISALDVVAQNASQISVCNMSFADKGLSQALNDAVTMCVNLGVVMCVAAGDNAANTSNYSPATAVGAICVGALCDTDGLPGGNGPAASNKDPDDTFDTASNFGQVIAVLAPGRDILSTIPVTQGSYGKMSGTSMATAHVSGLSALVLSTYGGAPNANGSGARNLIGGGVGGQIVISNPAQVLGFLQQDSVEQFPGLKANKDTRTNYPLVTARP